MTNHANCTHPATKSARAKCRRGGEQVTRVVKEIASTLVDVSVRQMRIERQITAFQLENTRKKVSKINDRAAKRGLAGTLTLTAEEIECSEVDELTKIERTWTEYAIVLEGTAPAYNGWECIARLDWDPHAGLIVSNVPGYEGVDRDFVREGWCDHCQTKRQRKVTYVVRNSETGETLQVGRSTCLKDFTGQYTTVSFPELPEEDDEEWFGSPSASPTEYSPETVLATSWAVVKLHGFIPVSSFDRTPTKSQVLDVLYPGNSKKARAFACTIAPLAEEAKSKARELLDFILSDEFAGDSDYVLNLKAVASGKLVSMRNFGLLVSAPQAYARHQEKTLIRERRKSIYEKSEHIGSEKERVELTVTLQVVRPVESDYGSKALYTMLTDEGDVVEWFSSNWTLGEDVDVNKPFKIRGTVKRHKVWNEMKSTLLTRCIVVEGL